MTLRLWLSTIALLLASFSVHSTQYSGSLGKSSITFQLDEGSALYFYDQYRTPIDLNSTAQTAQNTLIFFEKNTSGEPTGEFHLQKKGPQLVGYWLNIKTHQRLNVSLKMSEDSRGIIQQESFKNRYIRVKCLNSGTQMTLIDKLSDKTTQQLQVQSSDCQSFYTISVGDYNFDGFADFSTAGDYFAGPNTTNNYYLYQPQTQQYRFNPQLSILVTLKFNQQSQIITSTNQCCAGSSITVDSYRWQKNILKKFKGVCYKRNHHGALIAKDRKACD